MSLLPSELRHYLDEIGADWPDGRLLDWAERTFAALRLDEDSASTLFDLAIAGRIHRGMMELKRCPQVIVKLQIRDDGTFVRPIRIPARVVVCYMAMSGKEPANQA